MKSKSRPRTLNRIFTSILSILVILSSINISMIYAGEEVKTGNISDIVKSTSFVMDGDTENKDVLVMLNQLHGKTIVG